MRGIDFLSRVSVATVSSLLCGLAACGEPTQGAVLGEPDAYVALPAPGDADTAHDAATDATTDVPDRVEASAPTLISAAQVTGLIGSGLLLRTSTGEELAVQGDGTVSFATPFRVASGDALAIVQQPTRPAQSCSAQLASGALRVSCETMRFAVGGTASGIGGAGLVLESSWGERLTVGASGSFRFTQPVADGESYQVMVASSPPRPLQRCTVEKGDGRITARDVDDLLVTCTTEHFGFAGTVSGMLGDGLALELVGGETVQVRANGPFTLPDRLPDGSGYEVRVARQPSAPSQRCVVLDGVGTLSGAAVELYVVCGALGGLRVSEIGGCYYANSACWVELHNVGDAPEELSYYRLRSPSALREAPYTIDGSHEFTLPSATLAPDQRIVLRGRSYGSLPDGQGVFHIADGQALPWWSGDGFVELSSSGRTVDFVRFGDDATKPTTAGGWKSGAAPALPVKEDGYGHSIARDATSSDRDVGDDFMLRSFATPGGPNDVTSDADSDRDGIPDAAEIPGGRFAGLDLYAMGARIGARDVFVEIDHMDSDEPTVLPRQEALEKLVSVFASRNIAVHFDAGAMYANSFDPTKFNLGGGNVVPFAKGIGFGEQEGLADLYAYKAAHMAAARRPLFYYSLFAWSQKRTGAAGSSGIGERLGNDTIITLGGWSLDARTRIRTNQLINTQAATLMHELGHNFGLRHGGDDDFNNKPNYVSVMNYMYSIAGLPTIGRSEGDRYGLFSGCSVFSYFDLTNPPTGTPEAFVLDFSDGHSGDLSERSVDEAEGLGRAESTSVDYNCNKRTDGPYIRDVNEDDELDVLRDHDDWSNLEFVFRRDFSGNEHGPSFWPWSSAPERIDVLTDDAQALPAEPCPG
jgi:hypothetical protein